MATLYEVTGPDLKPRLIMAKTRAGARSYAAKHSIKVEKVSAERSHVLSARGVKIETATEEENDRASTEE